MGIHGAGCDRHDHNVTESDVLHDGAKDGTWRQLLPAMPASRKAYDFTFSSSNSTKERASMSDVLFGDVYICGGQSNMEFAIPAVANTTYERQRANAFSSIRLFSVGHRTSSPVPLRDLQSVWEGWQVASNTTIAKDYSKGHTLFSTFSAVCWLFGVELSYNLSPQAMCLSASYPQIGAVLA